MRLPILRALAVSAACAALAMASTASVAAPAETAELGRVPSTWPSEFPDDHSSSNALDVTSFDNEAWVVGQISNAKQPLRQPAGSVVQHCVKAGCSPQVLPDPSEAPDLVDVWVQGIAGTSPSNLWAFGSWHAGDNTESALIWRNVSGAWEQFPTTGMVGDTKVADLTFGPSGEVWAIVIEDFDGGTWVLYRLAGSTWEPVNRPGNLVFPEVCGTGVAMWDANVWQDLVLVGGQPTLVGECSGEPVVLKRNGDTWRRIDRGLPTDIRLENAAVVNSQLWVQGSRTPGDRTISIYRRASGKWLPVSTNGIPANANAQVADMAGTITRNLWMVGASGAVSGPGVPAAWRWTGAAWREVDIPATASSRILSAVDAKGFKPGWIVGARSSANPASNGLVLREK